MDSDHFEMTDVNQCASAYTHKNPANLCSGFFRPQKCYLGGGVLYRACCSIGTFQVTGIISGTSTRPSVPLIRVLTECVIRVLWSPKQREIFKLQFCWVRAVTWYKQCKNMGQHLFVRWLNQSGFIWGKRWWSFGMLNHMQTICTSLQTDNHTNTPSLWHDGKVHMW